MQGMSDSGLPPGCRAADLERGVSRLDDLSPGELWALLDQRQRDEVYREFFRRQWDELSACLEDEPAPRLGAAIGELWKGWRNTAVRRMALEGRIKLDEKE